MSFLLLLFLVTAGNLAIGFGLGVHFGFGPDFQRLTAQLHELRHTRGGKRSNQRDAVQSAGPADAHGAG